MLPIAQSRLIDMLFPDGLGAGADDADWQGWLCNNQARRARRVGCAGGGGCPAMAESEQTATQPPAAQIPARREPEMPRIEVPIAQQPIRETPEVVEVFYGKNRGRTSSSNDKQETAVAVLATTGGGMLAMLFCWSVFIRSGHRSTQSSHY